MKIFQRRKAETINNFYGNAPTEAEKRLMARADTLRAQLDQRDREAQNDAERLVQVRAIIEVHRTSGDDDETTFVDPEGALGAIWDAVN